jgi:hypothetical protein
MKKNDTVLSDGQRRNFKKHLKYGDMQEIADIAGVSKMTVQRWFSNGSHNMAVQDVVIEFFTQRSIDISKKVEEVLGFNQ